jgi:hypothetical protein
VQNNALYSIDPNIIQRPTPRLLDGIAAMCRSLAGG